MCKNRDFQMGLVVTSSSKSSGDKYIQFMFDTLVIKVVSDQ